MLAALTVDAEALYLANRALIDHIIRIVCRRAHASPADAEDFSSTAHLHLIDDDYRVLRAYEGRAELGAFLQAVIRRLFQDWRNANWGRFRPSQAARREGAVGVLLETLTLRDGLRVDQAITMMRANHGVAESEQALRALYDRLPARDIRSFEQIDALAQHPDRSIGEFAAADDRVRLREIRAAAERVSMALDRALDALPAGDQLLLRMRFESGHPVTTIAKVLALEAHTVRRRLDKLLMQVRTALIEAGVSASDAADVIARRGLDMLEEPGAATPDREGEIAR